MYEAAGFCRSTVLQGAGMETYFNTRELGEYLHIAEQSIRRWVTDGEIPYHRIHNVIRYRLSEIEKWVDEHQEKVPAFINAQNEKKLFEEVEAAGETAEGAEAAGVEHD